MQVSADGVFELGHIGASKLAVYGSGAFGGGTVTVGYLTNNRTFKPVLANGASNTVDFEFVYTKGSGVQGALSVTGSTTPNIEIQVGPVS